MTKVRKTITMEKSIAEVLDANCVRHGDVTFHVENALRDYFKVKAKPKLKPKQNFEEADAVISYLNSKAGTQYKCSDASRKPIVAILKLFTVRDCMKVVDIKTKEWLNTSMAKYLRPATLFQASKFESYLNQLEGFDNETSRSRSLASESERQTEIIQAKLAAGEFDQRPMGSDGSVIPAQMGESGRPEIGRGAIDAEFSLVVQEDGGLDR